MQKITSADTSIKQVPAVFKRVNFKTGTLNFDIGCGKYPDLLTDEMRRIGVMNIGWDPYHAKSNCQINSKFIYRKGCFDERFDTVTCSNVLNVIKPLDIKHNIVELAHKLLCKNGVAYFLIYEGDKTGVGRATTKGWQNNMKANRYEKIISCHFPVYIRKGNLIAASKVELNWNFA